MTKAQIFRELKQTGTFFSHEGAKRLNSGRGNLRRGLSTLKLGTAILRFRLDLIDFIATKRTRRLLKARKAKAR